MTIEPSLLYKRTLVRRGLSQARHHLERKTTDLNIELFILTLSRKSYSRFSIFSERKEAVSRGEIDGRQRRTSDLVASAQRLCLDPNLGLDLYLLEDLRIPMFLATLAEMALSIRSSMRFLSRTILLTMM